MENTPQQKEKKFTYTLKQRMVLDMFLIYAKEYNIDINEFKNIDILYTSTFKNIRNSIYSFMNGYQIYEILNDSQYDKHDISKIVGISKDYILMIGQHLNKMLNDGVDISKVIHTLPRRIEIKNLIKEGELSDKDIAEKFNVSKQYINTVRTTFELSYLEDVKQAIGKGMSNREIVNTYKVRDEFVNRVRMIPMIHDTYRRMNPYASDNISRLIELYPNMNQRFLEHVL